MKIVIRSALFLSISQSAEETIIFVCFQNAISHSSHHVFVFFLLMIKSIIMYAVCVSSISFLKIPLYTRSTNDYYYYYSALKSIHKHLAMSVAYFIVLVS